MKAMILAAGLGTRLRPLTNDRPKALVRVDGRTMLEIALARLKQFGVDEVIVNTHHYAGMMAEYLRANGNFGMRIEISQEEVLLDTGGGLKKAAHFFRRDGNFDQPFLVHNVDVISGIDLGRMVAAHRQRAALATLAVMTRDSSRQLLFDSDGLLCGRSVGRDSEPEMVRNVPACEPKAFCGVHVLSPQIFDRMTEEGVFSIIAAYLRLAGEGGRIVAFDVDGVDWRDLGTAASVAAAEAHPVPPPAPAESLGPKALGDVS